MKSNLVHWQKLQDKSYFERHSTYKGLVDLRIVDVPDAECGVIEWFYPLTGNEKVVVIGCGYGRESVHIARRVAHVWGIDVSQRILDKAVRYTRQHDVANFTTVLAENFSTTIPGGIDIVFSIVVFQHITRDLARNYLSLLGRKLAPTGKMVIQFLEDLDATPGNDADLRVYEPAVSYNVRQVVQMSLSLGLRLEGARSYMVSSNQLWHWVCLVRA
jgi:SAM-dependent methyltransferase